MKHTSTKVCYRFTSQKSRLTCYRDQQPETSHVKQLQQTHLIIIHSTN